MKAKHTPPPWRIGRPSVMNGVQIFRDYDFPARVDIICTMPERGKGRTANARLIVAAPELLAACEMAVKELKAWQKDHGEDIKTQEAIALGLVAIAKATGA